MEQLGIDGQLLATQLINFLIIMAILARFLYKPILKTIRDRQKRIEEGLNLAESMELERQKLQLLRTKTIQEAQVEAQKIINSVKKDATTLKEEIIAKGHQEVVALRQRQEADSVLYRKQMEHNLANQTVGVAQHLVRQLLGDILSQKQHRQLIELQLTKLMRQYEKSTRSH